MSTHTDVLLAGAFAAFTVDLLVYPLDTLKTRFQSPDYKKIYYDASKNIINRKVLFRGLYQGVGPVIMITIPSSGAFFTTYEAVKSGLTKLNPTLSGSAKPLVPLPLIHSAASATAELVSCFILTPAEVLKQNAQMIRQPAAQDVSKGTLQTSASLEALRKFKKNPTQLWRGYTALAARNLPFTAMHFPMFEYLKTTIKEYKKRNGTFTGGTIETAMITAFSAGSAGSVAAVITTPIDVVKTRIMLSAAGESSEKEAVEKARQKGQTLERMARKQNSTRKGGINVAREVFLESGVKGLFRGSILRGTWTAVGSGLYLGVYESGKDWLGSRRENSQIE